MLSYYSQFRDVWKREISGSVKTNAVMVSVIRFSICQIQHQCCYSHAPIPNKIRSTYNFKDIQ